MKQITIADIAKEAGVSKATVSRVLSKPNLVSEKTREKILSVINKYSFTPNTLAQGLAGMPTKNIGVMVDELANDYYIELTDGIDSILFQENYTVQLMSTRWIPERELQGVRSMILNRVDGVLISPASAESDAITLLKKSGIPYILINCTSGDPDVSYVCCDNHEGGRLIGEYANSLGREQAIVVPVSDHKTLIERVDAFCEYLDTAHIRLIKAPIARHFQDGYNLVSLLAEQNAIGTKKTILFVGNDYIAMGMISRLFELNIPIPEQVSVIGFDDIRIASLCRVPLTTVSQSIHTMGRLAALELIKRIRHNQDTLPYRHIIEPRLIIRESTSLSRA
jgi:DNA-binding LacI/PurR family transcriptional regulator